MKKNIIFIGALLIVIFMGMLLASRFYALNTQFTDENHYNNDFYEDQQNYEFILMHVSEIEKNELELIFIQGVLDLDLEEKSDAEILAAVNQLKEQVSTDIDYEPRYQRYQGMMGRSYDDATYGSCHGGYYDLDTTYEWYYLHASNLDRDDMTLNLVELIQSADFSSLSEEEKLDLLADIKTQVMTELNIEN